jgi:hypothetical protein
MKFYGILTEKLKTSLNYLDENLRDLLYHIRNFEIISFGYDRYFQFTLLYTKPEMYYLNWWIFQIPVVTKKQQEPILIFIGTD